MNTRYPRIREAYAGAALVRALDRVDALAHSAQAGSLVHLVLVQYLDILEAALSDEPKTEEGKTTGTAGSLLHRALEAVHQALDAYGLLEAEGTRLLN